MVKRTGPTNVHMRKLISILKKSESKLWKRVAKDLLKPARQRRKVNLSKINRYSKENETIVVPGKVLSNGEIIDKKRTIAAYAFSKASREKIKAAGSKALSLTELYEKNPKGKKVKLIG